MRVDPHGGMYIQPRWPQEVYIHKFRTKKSEEMEAYKKEQLLEMLNKEAESFGYMAGEPNFSIKVSIRCRDGWATVTEI